MTNQARKSLFDLGGVRAFGLERSSAPFDAEAP
jgi:hypothetical protein